MSNFVRTPPFLKTALWVAMEAMHFSIAKTKNLLGNIIFRIQGVQLNNLVPMKNCSGGGAR